MEADLRLSPERSVPGPLPGLAAAGFYTGAITCVENDLLQASFRNTTLVHSLIGFVLSMMLIFRTNTACDRWWEGCRL